MAQETDGLTMAVVPLMWVKNIEKSIRFYEEIGFKISEIWKPQERIQWCRVEFHGAALMLQQTADLESQRPIGQDTGIQLYFITDDVDVIYHQMRARGIDVSAPKIEFYGMKQVFLTDPDGRTLCFESLQPK
ncbi:MAG: VOC family protein [Gammaproteobacteria bacterium]|nr:VOC family protein [Gammaproteobacteria bacterium]